MQSSPPVIRPHHMEEYLQLLHESLVHMRESLVKTRNRYYTMNKCSPLKERTKAIVYADMVEEKFEARKAQYLAAVIEISNSRSWEEWREELVVNGIDLSTLPPSELNDGVDSESYSPFSSSSDSMK